MGKPRYPLAEPIIFLGSGMGLALIGNSHPAWLLRNLASAFLLPPASLILLCAAGLYLSARRPRLGRMISIGALLALWLLSTPAVAQLLLARLEGAPPNQTVDCSATLAIVVLGGGSYLAPNEFGKDTASASSFERVRLAAWIYRQGKKPIALTGGAPDGPHSPEGELMRQALVGEFGVPVAWVEGASDNTRQNAELTGRLLLPQNVSSICLVTHAWHMPRARRAFEKAGFRVIPAGVGYRERGRLSVLDFTPNASALHDSSHFMHELIGMLWYSLF